MKKIFFVTLMLPIAVVAISSNAGAMKRPADCAAEDYANTQEDLIERCASRTKTSNGYKSHSKEIARKRAHEDAETSSDNMVDYAEFVQPEEKRTKSEDSKVTRDRKPLAPEKFEEQLKFYLTNKSLFINFATNASLPGFKIDEETAEEMYESLIRSKKEEDFKASLKSRLNDKNAFISFVLGSEAIFGYDFTPEIAEQMFDELKQEQLTQEAEETELCKQIVAMAV